MGIAILVNQMKSTIFWLLLAIAPSSLVHAQSQPPPTVDNPSLSKQPPADDTDNGWPREFSDGVQITVYQPQVESWKGNQLKERAAVSIRAAASAIPTYGVIWISARTEVDKANRLVTLEDVQIMRGSFPANPRMTSTYLDQVRKNTPGLVKQIALDRLQANLAVTKAEEKSKPSALEHSPPRIIYSKTPAILVLVDGQPALRDSGVEKVLRVINTRALLLLDQSTAIIISTWAIDGWRRPPRMVPGFSRSLRRLLWIRRKKSP